MNDTQLNKIKIKIGVLGDQGVGKSYLINTFVNSVKEVQNCKNLIISFGRS